MFLEARPYWPVTWSIPEVQRKSSSFLNAKIMNSTKLRSKRFLDSHRNGDFKMIASKYAIVRKGLLLSRASLRRIAYHMIAGLILG